MKTYGPDTIFNFGKHKGKTLREVVQTDFSYIIWCDQNVRNFHISTDTVKQINNKMLTLYFSATELREKMLSQAREKQLVQQNSLNKIKFKQPYYEFWDSEIYSYNGLDNYGCSYEKYGGYNGFSDDVIDDAFEGDPMATWNVD